MSTGSSSSSAFVMRRPGASERNQARVARHRDQGIDVHAGFVVNPAARVADGDDLRARLAQELRGDAADVAEALYRDGRAFKRHAGILAGLLRDEQDAASGRLEAAAAAADRHRLAGDDAGDGVAVHHAVGVHDPGHDLRVGAHVRRRDVFVRADEDADLGGEASCQALQLAVAESFGSTITPPLAPP